MKNGLSIIGVLVTLFTFTSCVEEDNAIPKPTGYFRIDMPNPEYELYSEMCPFEFEKPKHAILMDKDDNRCFKNLYYPNLKATVYLTYLPIDSNFNEVVKFTDDKVYEHHNMASGIQTSEFTNYDYKVYGNSYELMGDVAVNYLFFLTDSTNHYFGGQLYFESVPNYDSLKPCIDFVINDMKHLIETFKWKLSISEL